VEVQEALGDFVGTEVFMYSISLDGEEIDTPEVLARYAESFDVGPGWTFLTGDAGEIDQLRHRLGVYDPDPVIDADKTQHAGLIVCGNEPLAKWSAIPGGLPPGAFIDSMMRTLRKRWRRTAGNPGSLKKD
jgi:protein SCO1/2